MRITTLVKNYFIYFVLLLCLFGYNNTVYSQCPTVTNSAQSFCDSQSPTVANLVATDNGGGIKWYATSNSTTALSNSTVLINGEDYFADDNTGTCGSRHSVVVTIYSAPTGLNFQGVCVTNLNQAVITNPQFSIAGIGLQWYTTPTGGTPLTTSTILTDNTIYYISQTNPDTGCQTTRLSLFVNVGLVPVPTGAPVQEFCNNSGNPPTVANLDASGNNNWYLTPTLGLPLDVSTPLINGQFYYATTVDPPCESSDRLQVLVNIYEPNDAGNDATRGICVNQVSSTSPFDLFNLLGGTPDNTGVWTGPITTTNGFQGTLDVSTMTVAGSPYVFTYTVSSAICATDTSTVTISILPLPIVSVSVLPTTICSGSNAVFTFTGSPNATVTYTINGGSNQTIVLNASGIATLNGSYSLDTVISVVNVTSNGTPSCVNSQVSSTTLTVLPLPTASVSVSPTSICSGSTALVTFTGTPNATVTYTINSGANQTIVLDSSGTAILNNTYITNATITLVSIITSGTPACSRPLSQSVTITVINPTATISVLPTTICSGASATVTFTGTPNATVTYTVNGGANQTIVLNASGTAILSNPFPANTTITLINVTTSGTPTCTKSLSQSVTISVIIPTATISVSPTNICAGSSATITFTGTPNATVTYNINGGANQTILLNASGTASINNTYVANTTINLVSVSTSGVPNCVKALSQSVTITVINPTASVSVSPSTLCSGSNATITFTGTPNATVTFTVNSGANQTIILDASGTAILSNTYAVNTTITLVSVTTSGSSSCTKPLSQSVTITIIPEPTASISVSPTTICSSANVTINFTGTPNATVTYTINSGANQTITLNGSGIASLSNSYAVNTTITLVSVATSGTPSCTKPLSQSITITVINPTASISVASSTVCTGGSTTITFTGTPNATVTYTINSGANQTIVLNGIGTANLSNIIAVNTTINLVNVTSIGSPSCTTPLNQSVTITTVDPPIAGTSTSIALCITSSSIDLFTLLGSNAQSGGIWTPTLASGTGLFNPSVDISGAYTYTLIGSAPCGNATATVQVTVNPLPDAGQPNTFDICSNQNPTDLFSSLLGTPQTGGSWSPALASGTGIFNPAIDVSGVYTYTVTGVGGCSSATAAITVNVIPGPEAGNNNSITLCANGPTQDLFLLLGPNAQPGGTWSPVLASGTSVFNPAVDPQGNYTYTLSGTQPCDNDTAVISVTVTPIPNAGNDNSVSICSNSSGQDLFLSLGSNAIPGGTWTPALTSGTGIFNPAVDIAQTYTYTVGTALCGTDTSNVIVTITQAPNSGGAGQTLNACITNTSFDLFSGLNGTQESGIWNDDNASGALTGNIFNPSVAGVGTFNFTYTVNGNLPCANATSTVTVVVFALPNAGTFSGNVSLCPSVATIDLTTLLNGENSGGTWEDSTNQTVISPIDFSGFFPDVYTYTYSFTNVCGTDTEDVQFTVLPNPQLVSSNITISPVCVGTSVTVNLNGMVDGTYLLNYNLSGANTISGQSATVTITTGVGNFSIPNSIVPNFGTNHISITNITNTSSTCSTTLAGVSSQFIVKPLADIDSVNLSAAQACFGGDVVVNVTNAIFLSDGAYQFNYTLPNANPSVGVTPTFNVTAGVGQFILPASLFSSTGNFTLTIIGIVAQTGCTNPNENAILNFIISPIPSLTNATIIAQATCVNYQSQVIVTGASNFPDGIYTIGYQLSGANSSSATVSITITAGNGSFVIPSSDLANAGDTVLTLNQIISTISNCGQTGTIFNPITFSVGNLGTPQLIQDGNLFCIVNNPTIANLSANIVGLPSVLWYDAPTGGTVYNDTDLLVNGTTYYATLVAPSGCESGTRLQVIVDLTVCDDLIIPDGFSPNFDGINDTFEIANLPILYPNFKIEIFNRYGNIVYKGDINTPNWDGTTNQGGINLGNNILPTGVYFYILDFRDGVRKAVQGRVYLNR